MSQYIPQSKTVDFVALDMPGHGESTLTERVPVRDWMSLGSQYAQETVDHYRPKYDQVLALGHSYGAASLMLLEAEQPGTFEKLLVYEPITVPRTIPAPLSPLIKRFAPMAVKAKQQQNGWETMEDARSYFSTRRAFSTWDPEVFQLFLDWCLKQNSTSGELTLKLDPETEADAFSLRPRPFSTFQGVKTNHTVAYGELTTNLDSVPFQFMKTPEVYQRLSQLLPGLGHAVECHGCGHLMVCENPDLIAWHCARYLLDSSVERNPAPSKL